MGERGCGYIIVETKKRKGSVPEMRGRRGSVLEMRGRKE